MKVVDNFVPIKYQNELENLFLGTSFSWFYNPSTVDYRTVGTTPTPNTLEGTQFTHVFYAGNEVLSNFYGVVQPLLFNLVLQENLCIDEVLKVKANLTPKDSSASKTQYRTPHVDYTGSTPCTTMIYYVNDSDGDTVFFDDAGEITNKIAPKKGRLVIFDSKIVHAGQPPVISDTRVLLNINIFNTGYTQ